MVAFRHLPPLFKRPASATVVTTALCRHRKQTGGHVRTSSNRQWLRSSRHITLLVVDDQEFDVQLIGRSLREYGFEPFLQRVASEQQLTDALGGMRFDAVLLDFRMPELDLFDALAIVRANDELVPVIVVSGGIQTEAMIDAVRRGADDFVSKDDLSRLGVAIDTAIVAARNERRRRQAEVELEEVHVQAAEQVRRLRDQIYRAQRQLLTDVAGELRRTVTQLDELRENLADPGQNPKSQARLATLTDNVALSAERLVKFIGQDANAREQRRRSGLTEI